VFLMNSCEHLRTVEHAIEFPPVLRRAFGPERIENSCQLW
jgi:hypothetical protein